MVTQSSDSPYIEAAEKALECSFRSFEITEVMSEKGVSQSSEGLTVQKRQMQEQGWSDGKGLGKNLQGDPKLVDWPHQDNTFGLGFKPSWKDKQQMREKRKAQRLARKEGACMEEGKEMKFRRSVKPLYQLVGLTLISMGKHRFQSSLFKEECIIWPSMQLMMRHRIS